MNNSHILGFVFSDYHADVACEYRSPVPIYPFAFRTHAHELGKVISGYIVEGAYRGKMREIAKGDPQWPQVRWRIYDLGFLMWG